MASCISHKYMNTFQITKPEGGGGGEEKGNLDNWLTTEKNFGREF